MLFKRFSFPCQTVFFSFSFSFSLPYFFAAGHHTGGERCQGLARWVAVAMPSPLPFSFPWGLIGAHWTRRKLAEASGSERKSLGQRLSGATFEFPRPAPPGPSPALAVVHLDCLRFSPRDGRRHRPARPGRLIGRGGAGCGALILGAGRGPRGAEPPCLVRRPRVAVALLFVRGRVQKGRISFYGP